MLPLSATGQCPPLLARPISRAPPTKHRRCHLENAVRAVSCIRIGGDVVWVLKMTWPGPATRRATSGVGCEGLWLGLVGGWGWGVGLVVFVEAGLYGAVGDAEPSGEAVHGDPIGAGGY